MEYLSLLLLLRDMSKAMDILVSLGQHEVGLKRTKPRTMAAFVARLWRIGLSVAMMLQWHHADALDPGRLISQYAHTSWRTQDGLFSGYPDAMAQTADGYLWIGTQTGLLRFDGVRFTAWTRPDQSQLPSFNVASLLADPDGSLWVGTETGLIRWKDNQWLIYRGVRGRVNAMVRDGRGAIWAVQTRMPEGDKPLCHVTNTQTLCYGEAEGVAFSGAEALAIDQRENLWVGDDALLRWKPGSFSRYPLKGLNPQLDGVAALAATDDGSLWVGVGRSGVHLGLQKFIHGAWKPFRTPELDGRLLNVQALYLDREKNLWVGTARQGLYRIRDAKVDHFGTADGLSSDDVYNFHEDREGNLWIATSRGLDNLRDTRVVTFSTREGLSADEVNSVLAKRDGSVLIGSSEGLDVLHPGSLSAAPAAGALARNQITALLEDHAGRLWIGRENGLLLNREGSFREIRRQDGAPLGLVTGIAEDVENNIWVEAIGSPRTLMRIQNLEVTQMFPAPRMPEARKLTSDPHGGIWLGLMSGDLARLRKGKLDLFSVSNLSSRIDQVSISPDGAVLGATALGLIAWRDGIKQILTVHNGLPCNGVNAFLFDRQNALWLYTQCGLVQIQGTEWERWWTKGDAKLQMKLFDTSDGVQAGNALFNPAARDTGGRLWFANGVMLQMIDPAKLDGNSLPPPVHIETIIADRQSYSAQQPLRFPALTRDLEINYTALSFVVPQKVRFRYRLIGHDQSWQEAGARRQAFYNNLLPGSYTFWVIACNNDGVWNQTGACLHFVIVPAFYQTAWFKVLLGILFLGVIWLIHSLRLKQATAQTQARLGERLEERSRIARELHDTLIQSVDGLMLRLQTALDEPNAARSHQMIEKALDSADEVMFEGRQRVHTLRAEAIHINELSEALASYGNELAEVHPIAFSVALVGSPRPMNAFVRDEAYRIAREALFNAFQHSGATAIEVEITYDRAKVRIRVRDNGRGIDPQILNGGRPGHYGLSGIRERAQTIGSQLVIWSGPGAGTEVDLEIPSAVAYHNGLRGSGLHRIRGWMGDRKEKR